MEKKIIFVKKMAKVKAISIVILLILAIGTVIYFLPWYFWEGVLAVIVGTFIYHWIDNFFKAVDADLEKDQEIHKPSESETLTFYDSLEKRLKEENERKN